MDQIEELRDSLERRVESLNRHNRLFGSGSFEELNGLYESICIDAARMEDMISESLEFYDIELPEIDDYRNSLKQLRTSSREIWSEIQQKESLRKTTQEREQLFQQTKSVSITSNRDIKEESKKINTSLLHTVNLLKENQTSLSAAGSVLDEDRDTMNKTNDTLREYGNTMKKSNNSVTRMKKQEKYENRVLTVALVFFFITVLFVLGQRSYGLIQLPIRIINWFVSLFKRDYSCLLYNPPYAF